MPDSNGLTILEDLPDAVIFGEILVRLSAKDVFRCRAVHKSWRCGTSSRNFLTDHHRRQPKHPIIYFCRYADCDSASHLRRYVIRPNAGIGTANQKLMVVLSSDEAGRLLMLHAARDGLLIVSSTVHPGSFSVYNPATQQRTLIPQLAGYSSEISIVGFYRHNASGEYRVLYWDHFTDVYCILALGSDEPPRCIGYPLVLSLSFREVLLEQVPSSLAPILHRDNLHWHDSGIVVFCTTTEMFRRMRDPVLESDTPRACLLEMEGMLAMCSNPVGLVINIWVMQVYEAEVWESKYLINLMVAPPKWPLCVLHRLFKVVVVNERELLIQFPYTDLMLFDIDGRLIGNTQSCIYTGQSFRQRTRLNHTLHSAVLDIDNKNP
ncbi:F-box protein At5g49610-like [Aegilops tauschii subsp. strangulata]|uniref:F-box protein At5g49610-like n=1 Tax=Aegilops tauschii subsp. strangulata TaxID=200361 RepID=UPI003CC8ACAE